MTVVGGCHVYNAASSDLVGATSGRSQKMTRFQPGDRVVVTNSEFPTWRPTQATVMKLWIKFPNAEPPMRRMMIQVQLDEHPFPEYIFEPIRDLGFEMEDPNFHLELLQDGDA